MGIRFSIPRKAINNYALDPFLWYPASILKDSKLSGVLVTSSWVVWIHEKIQLDPLRLVHIRPINLFHLLYLEGGKATEDLENLLMAIVWIEILQQKCDHSVLF
jgi:hypothetical protein